MLRLSLAEGDNSVSNAGTIEGNLTVVTPSEDDVVVTDEGAVNGETTVIAPADVEPGCGGHVAHRGGWNHGRGFGYGGFGFGRGWFGIGKAGRR